MGKTNAIRLVEQGQIPYREAYYPFDESDLSGLHAAEAIGLPPEQVFKTLVARGERTGIAVFCIPVCCGLDLKKGCPGHWRQKGRAGPCEGALSLTGYIRGGCGPVGMKKKYPTFFDETALLFEEIAVSAGERGHQMLLSPERLAQFVQAELLDLTE